MQGRDDQGVAFVHFCCYPNEGMFLPSWPEAALFSMTPHMRQARVLFMLLLLSNSQLHRCKAQARDTPGNHPIWQVLGTISSLRKLPHLAVLRIDSCQEASGAVSALVMQCNKNWPTDNPLMSACCGFLGQGS